MVFYYDEIEIEFSNTDFTLFKNGGNNNVVALISDHRSNDPSIIIFEQNAKTYVNKSWH